MNPGLFAMAAAALGFVSVAGVGLALVEPDENKKLGMRARMLTREAQDAERNRARNAGADQSSRRKALLQTLKEADRKQRKAHVSLPAKLQQAGLTISPVVFWILNGLLAVLVLGAALVLKAPFALALGLGFSLGLGAPRWVLSFLGKRRIKRYTEELPNAVDIIVRGVKAGLPVHDCLHIIARESPDPVGSEFKRLVENMGLGLAVDQALERAYERTPTPELRFFTIVLAIQQKTGGNLAEALGNLSAVLRARKLMHEKIKALSSEATTSAFIIALLPPGVMVLVTVMTPAYMMIMFTDPRGQLMLAASAVWMSIGGLIMRRMINFKF